MNSLDKETIYEELTLDRVQQDIKRKHKGDRIRFFVYLALTAAFALACCFFVHFIIETQSDPISARFNNPIPYIFDILLCVLYVVFIFPDVVLAAWFVFRSLTLIRVLRAREFEVYRDVLKSKKFLFAFCTGRLTFLHSGNFFAMTRHGMYRWSDLFATQFVYIIKDANPGDKYYLVSLDGKRIDMIYNANWFVLSDEVKALLVNDAVSGGISPLPD